MSGELSSRERQTLLFLNEQPIALDTQGLLTELDEAMYNLQQNEDYEDTYDEGWYDALYYITKRLILRKEDQ